MWQGQASISVQYIARHCRGETWGRKENVDKRDSGKKNPLICLLGVINTNFKHVNNIYWGISLQRFVVFNASVSNGEEIGHIKLASWDKTSAKLF